MCIISGPVTTVKSTKILVLPSSDGSRQLTVYRNSVDTPAENVMCLPVPNIASIKLETVYDTLFDDCDKSFMRGRGGSAITNYASSDSVSYLPIIDHGSYSVVIVPSIADLHRVPESIATLTHDVKTFLQENYPHAGWGILLCKLKPGGTNYTPFAYSHTCISPGKLFVPTKHYHPHTRKMDIHKPWHASTVPEYFSSSFTYNPYLSEDSINADWDHDIYSCLTPLSVHKKASTIPSTKNMINWSKIPLEFAVGEDSPLRCHSRVGSHYPNEDIEFPFIYSTESAKPSAESSTSPFWKWFGL